jgi:hypothetical protein
MGPSKEFFQMYIMKNKNRKKKKWRGRELQTI